MAENFWILGFHPPNEKWQQMKKVWDACSEAEIEPPKDVSEFFDYSAPDERGVEVILAGYNGYPDAEKAEYRHVSCSPAGGMSHPYQGYDIDLSQLPKNITSLRCHSEQYEARDH